MFDRTTIAVRNDPCADTSPARSTPLELSVLVPTRNEAGNIEELLRRVAAAVASVPTEVVFIDDSDDITAVVIRTVARRGGGGACQGPSSTASVPPAHRGLVSSTRTFSIPPRPSRGCSPRRTAMGSTWWWLAGTASRDAPKGSGWSAG
jgi:hypothetical protein